MLYVLQVPPSGPKAASQSAEPSSQSKDNTVRVVLILYVFGKTSKTRLKDDMFQQGKRKRSEETAKVSPTLFVLVVIELFYLACPYTTMLFSGFRTRNSSGVFWWRT
jgi:hypothetical protein